MTDELTPAQKAAETKRLRYGEAGLSRIAEEAYNTRRQQRADRLNELEAHLARTAAAAMSRARRAGLLYETDLVGWAIATMIAQKHRRAVSGRAFRLDALGYGAAPRPYAPSIDRRDARGGYTRGNIRVICWAANCLLSTWGDEVALDVARGMVAKSERKVGDA